MRQSYGLLGVTILLTAVMAQGFQGNPDGRLLSRAERTNYTETSRYSDVLEFISELQRSSASVKVEHFGVTKENRALPLVILSRPAIRTPGEAAACGKPLVFIMANIHAGEVEGKEAAQHLMRDVVTGSLSYFLDKMILLVAPIYNADGNEKIDINHRTEQNGPAGVGSRENSQGLDLNRDFMKLETPEARGLIANVFNKWDPHVIIDLHTTNGSYHGYALTYSPALNPNADKRLISLVRERLLPSVSKTLWSKYGYRTYFYGNFADERNPNRELTADKTGEPKAWATFDHRPRFGNNYEGLRNRLAILSEAYSYLDFRSRVDVTAKFVRAILDYIAGHSDEVMRVVREADRTAIETGTTAGNEAGFGVAFQKQPSSEPVDILVGSVTKSIDARTNKLRLQATSEARPVRMTEYGEFRATRRIAPPGAYMLKADQRKIGDLLLAHGVVVEVLRQQATLDAEQYIVKGVAKSAQLFQGHRETRLTVAATAAQEAFPEGSFIVSMHQPKAALIFYLLEPESDDGIANWNFLDGVLEQAAKGNGQQVYPIYRLKEDPRVPRYILGQ